VINCELVSTILVSPLNPKVVTAINSIITGALGGILFDFINTVTR